MIKNTTFCKHHEVSSIVFNAASILGTTFFQRIRSNLTKLAHAHFIALGAVHSYLFRVLIGPQCC